MAQMRLVQAAAQSGYCADRWRIYMAWTRATAKKERKQADALFGELSDHMRNCPVCMAHFRAHSKIAESAYITGDIDDEHTRL